MSGLTVPGLVLALNDGSTRTISANGTYAFVPGVPTGFACGVTIQTLPSGVACTVSNGRGTMAHAAVTDVNVSCAALGPAIFSDGFESAPWGSQRGGASAAPPFDAPVCVRFGACRCSL